MGRIARTGLEPVLSALRGRRVNQLHQRAVLVNSAYITHFGIFASMSSSLTLTIKERLLALLHENYQINFDETPVEVPPKTELGDLAFPIAFELAKRIKTATGEKKNPRELANKLSEGLKTIPGIARVEVAGAGYLNLFFDRGETFTQLIDSQASSDI